MQGSAELDAGTEMKTVPLKAEDPGEKWGRRKRGRAATKGEVSILYSRWEMIVGRNDRREQIGKWLLGEGNIQKRSFAIQHLSRRSGTLQDIFNEENEIKAVRKEQTSLQNRPRTKKNQSESGIFWVGGEGRRCGRENDLRQRKN